MKFSNHHLLTTAIQEQIKVHVASGKQVESLALSWYGRVSFVLGENLSLKQITIIDGGKDDQDAADAFDASVATVLIP